MPDSMTEPIGLPSTGAFNSRTSDWSKIVSNSSSTPSPEMADTLTNKYSPPSSSGRISSAINSFLTFSKSDSGLSILLIATIIGTLADFACSIASLV